MPTPPGRPETLPPPLRKRLHTAREALLQLHKSLLDVERTRYERAEGSIANSYRFLQLVIGDPWFAWLRPMSELIAAIDAARTARTPVPPADAERLLDRTRELLSPVAGQEGFAGQALTDG